MNTDKPAPDTNLESLQREAFSYFLEWTNPQIGLVRDKSIFQRPTSIAATRLALAVQQGRLLVSHQPKADL